MTQPNIQINVNGLATPCKLTPGTPLLYWLRNDLGLRRVRFGCGQGLCGACTVVIDGHAMLSCDVPVWSVNGKNVCTPEGVDRAGIGQTLTASLIRHQAAQCAYCISGILMRSVALLEKMPNATRTEIAHALEKNLCRCGAHQRILDAVEAARDINAHNLLTATAPDFK
jgi:nicotinate dehydrogenase subunit A